MSQQLAPRMGGLLVASILLATSAHASTVYVQTTPAGAEALFPGSSAITFDGAAAGEYAAYSDKGVTFTSDTGHMFIDSAFINAYNTFGVNSLHNCYCADTFGAVTMTFASPVSGFGFFWGASDTQWTLSAYDASSTLIESFLLPITHASDAGDFVGIKDPGIKFAVLSGASGDYIFIDNVTGIGGGVPEPATWALMLGGFGLIGATLRRRLIRTVQATCAADPGIGGVALSGRETGARP